MSKEYKYRFTPESVGTDLNGCDIYNVEKQGAKVIVFFREERLLIEFGDFECSSDKKLDATEAYKLIKGTKGFKLKSWPGINECDLTFGLAIEALKQGKLVARKGWNGKGMFVMKQIPTEIGLDIIPKMQSVQKSAKELLVLRGTTLKYQNQMLIIKPNGIADSWVPSSSDVFAEDWFILE